MNYDNLHELISRYEANMSLLYEESSNDELFKWRAMQTWRENWFKPADAFNSFADRFNASRKEFSLFIDNSRMHPSNGVMKLWEAEAETVEHLFHDVLFADANGDAAAAQNNMDRFLEEYEALRQRHFPTNWSYKQDRHSASVFMAMNDPEFNFVYKSSEAQAMAKYIGFGLNIGSGMSFSLPHYYQLCETIISAMSEHPDFLDKHREYLDERHYADEGLHLLAFDLMYCCRAYGYYKGLTVPSTGKTIKKSAGSVPTAEELASLEEARLAKIAALEEEIAQLERSYDGCEDISLLGVQVTEKESGTGIVVAQTINQITVDFEGVRKKFVLDKKYFRRPRFENDSEIVEAFTTYGRARERIAFLQTQIDALSESK